MGMIESKDHLRAISFFIVLILLIISCRIFSSVEDPTPTAPIKTNTPPPTATNTTTPTRDALPTLPSSGCVPYQDGIVLPAEDFSDYPQAILAFLNQGGKPEFLAQILEAQQVSRPPFILAAVDMVGNGLTDVAVALVNTGEVAAFAPPGELLIYICLGNTYGLVYRRASMDLEAAPQIHEALDLNDDGSAELLVGYTTCGAHTCFEELDILAWTGENFSDRLIGETADLPSPLVAVNDADGDGVFDLLVTGRGFGSVGAGPPRPHTRLWSYNPGYGLWELEREFPGASEYRIHIIYDADAATRSGDYPYALALYQQALDDPTLQNWDIHDQADLIAYAHFKMVLLNLILGENNIADAHYQELVGSYPPNSPQYVFLEMSVLFRNGFVAGGASAGCGEVRTYIIQNTNRVLPLFDYGYGNPEYTPKDICPW